MQEENYLNIKSGSRVSEDAMSFVVEDLKFHLAIKIKLDSIEISIKELESGANYISKKTLSEFLKNEIFKGSQNSQTIKEIIFKIIINNLAKISFNNNKCYLNLGIKNPASSNTIGAGASLNSNKELNYQIELVEDTDVNSLVQNFLRKTDELEKENKNLKFEVEKIKSDFARFKEEKNKEIKDIKVNETEGKNEIINLKSLIETLTILVSNAINNRDSSSSGNANILVAPGNSNTNNNINEANNQNKNLQENKFFNNFSSSISKSSQNNALNNLFNTSPASASIFQSNQSPNIDANRDKLKSSDNVLENINNKNYNKSASPIKFLNNVSNQVKIHSSNNIYDNILMQNILNPKKINLNNAEREKSPTSDSPPISIRRQVEQMSINKNFSSNNRNNSNTSPINTKNNLNLEAVNIINSSPISYNNINSQKRISNLANAEKPGNIDVADGNNKNLNANQTENFLGNLANNNQNINRLINLAAEKNEEAKNNFSSNNNYNNQLNNIKDNFSNNKNIQTERLDLNYNNDQIPNNINTNNPLFTFSNNMQTPISIQDEKNNNNNNNNYNNNISNNKRNNIIINNDHNNTNNLNVPNHLVTQKTNELLHFLSENPVHIPSPYKYTDLILKKPISCFKLENNIKFFYQVNKGEISDTTLWSPFDEEDCILLELYYPNYLIGGPCEVYLEKLEKLINFKYMMLVDAENSENHIHIKRSLPGNLHNIIRKNRFNFDEVLPAESLKNRVLPSLNVLKDYSKYQEYFVCFEFSFIKNHNFEVKIPKKFEYLYLECIRRSNYGAFLVSLREEVENLRLKFAKRNSIYLNYLDNLENSPKFFQIVIQMYSEDGFLSKELNKVLRKPTLEKLDKIKYFYLAVLVSLTYCSLNVRPKTGYKNSNLKNKSNGFSGFNDNNPVEKGNNNNNDEAIVKTEESFGGNKKKIIEKEKDVLLDSCVLNVNKDNSSACVEKNYFIYSPYKLSSEELGFYKENKFNILFFDEFISATPNKVKAENYLKAFKSMEGTENEQKDYAELKGKHSKNHSIKENPNNFSNGNNNLENEEEYEINNSNNFFEENKTKYIKNKNINEKSKAQTEIISENNNTKKNNKNNLSVMFEIEVPYYMLESENMHIDSIAFAYEQNFSLYPQDEEVILKSGSILMLKDIVQNSKEVYQYTVKFVVLSFSWKGFFDCLAYNQTTKEINLNKNGIGNFRKSVKYLCEALVKNKNIEKLCLSENHFGENYESMKYLANLISISNFALTANNIDNNNNLKIAESLKNLPENFCNDLLNNKNKINQNYNNENIKLLSYFSLTSEIYQSSIPKLKILDLSSNSIGKEPIITKLFCDALSINQNLLHLDLSQNYLSEIESAKALSSALISNKFLKKLNLNANNLGSNLLAMNYISEAILHNSYISELSLSDNNLGERADIVKNFADSLSRNKVLKSLDLSSNNFGINSISVRYLAEGLILNENVIQLDLKNNVLGNLESLSYLCALLEKNWNLESLDLSKNKFGLNKESYTLLGEAISVNKSIHTLNLSNNNLNSHLDYLRCLLDSLRCNIRLRKIYLSYNSLSNNEDFKMFMKIMLKDRNINYLGTSEI